MSATPTRRNDPCPCGSGLRFKECHGKLPGDTAPGVDALIARALQFHQQGRIDEAERGYREILARDPGNAIATHYLGMVTWTRGDRVEAERLLRASIAANATIPDFHNNLALLLRDTGRLEEAIAGFRKTLEVDALWYEAHNNLGLALEDALEFAAAEAEYREAIAREPRYAAAQQNLARLLLSQGRFPEAWDRYRWRQVAQGIARAAPVADAPRLAESLAGRQFALVAEQGLGDILFFLRFAPELVGRGAALAFRGDPRLHRIVERTRCFALGCAGESAGIGALETIAIGDLPWLLAAHEPERFPGPLALAALPERTAALRSRLPADGRPRIAITWRSGAESAGPSRTQVKQVPIDDLGAALRGLAVTWVSLQRAPRPGEREALEKSIQAPVHDFADVNSDLEDALAILALVQEYVGTSNANTHLAAGLGLGQHVLVPNPPEWRWLAEGRASPWFPKARIYRPHSGSWIESLRELRRGLEG